MAEPATLTSLQTSPEAKRLWENLQDIQKNEVAWAIIEDFLLARDLQKTLGAEEAPVVQ